MTVLQFTQKYANGVEAAVRARSGGLDEANVVIARLASLTVPLIENGDQYGYQPGALAAWLNNQAVEGDITPEQFMNTARQIVVDYQAQQLATVALSAARTQAKERLALLGRGDKLLAEFHIAFRLLNEDLDSLGDLSGLDDGDQAAAAGRSEDRQHYLTLLSAYTRLRREHFTALAELLTVGKVSDLVYPEVAVLRHAAKSFPLYSPWRTHGALISQRNLSTQMPILPPWPTVRDPRERNTRDSVIDDTVAPAFWLWARKHQLELWMPNAAEYEQALAEVRTAHREAATKDFETTDGFVHPGGPKAEALNRGRSLR